MLLESGVKHHNPKTNCLRNINKEYKKKKGNRNVLRHRMHHKLYVLTQTCCLKANLVEKIEPKYLKKKSFVFWLCRWFSKCPRRYLILSENTFKAGIKSPFSPSNIKSLGISYKYRIFFRIDNFFSWKTI
jgi:hypothetical protein